MWARERSQRETWVKAIGRGFEKCSDLPPPVVLLHNHNGPLLFSTHLQLGDVRLVLPPLPVRRDNDLRVSQLHPVLSGVPPDEDNENGDNAMVGSR